MKISGNMSKYFWMFMGLLALGIVAYVLFKFPQPGVADQGDFTRVMCVSGLELKAENRDDPNFVRFLDYTVTDYQISETTGWHLLARAGASSIAYLITMISALCKIFGQDVFKTSYIAFSYIMIYIMALHVIFKYLNISGKVKLVMFALTAFFILLDGNYLIWFNSLYGEPMMITTMALYIAAWIYYIYHRHVIDNNKKIFPGILFVFTAAFLFLGSKIQVAYVLPALLIMLYKLLADNKRLLRQSQRWLLCFFYAAIVVYPLGLILQDESISKDRQYNSVFYGVLNDSKEPAQDLMAMGLNPDMAVEAGKHSYLPVQEYVKYIPHTQITREEFYNKISNIKIVKFYLTHPKRLLEGMEYTSSQAFYTSTFLGKYDSEYSEEPIRDFNRFTLWSSFREKQLPRHLWFVALVYCAVIGVSVLAYIKNRGFKDVRAKIELLWWIMLIGLVQFPMPYIGNGRADTAKQLYLFNFIFDLLLLVTFCWSLNKFISLVNLRDFKIRGLLLSERD